MKKSIFIVFIKTDDIYRDIADVETRFDTSNSVFDTFKSLPKIKNKKVNGLTKGELAGKIMTKVVGIIKKKL